MGTGTTLGCMVQRKGLWRVHLQREQTYRYGCSKRRLCRFAPVAKTCPPTDCSPRPYTLGMTPHMLLRAVVGVAITLLILSFAGQRLSFLVGLVRSGKPAVGRLLEVPKRVQAEAFEV